MLFYYRTGELWTQIEADSYRRGNRYGWYQNLVWQSGLREVVPQGDTNPESRYYTDGRCGYDSDGILYRNQFGFTSCGRDGRPPRQVLSSISWFFVRCSIDFIRNGAVIRTVSGIDGCPEVQIDPRDQGCSECCRQILPMVRALHI